MIHTVKFILLCLTLLLNSCSSTSSKPPVSETPRPPPKLAESEASLPIGAHIGGVRGGTAHQPDKNLRLPSVNINTENYAHINENSIKRVIEQPVSTFSIDVDTGAYANIRRIINSGRLPRRGAVRVEEMVNYFNYDYASPRTTNPPFSVITEIAPTPWNADTLLLHIGIKGYDIDKHDLPPANLVFLVDISGSMNSPSKLGLLKSSLTLLMQQMSEQDRIAIVVYAGAAGLVLEPTPASQHAKISAALQQLNAGGSTNGGQGIQLAYHVARQAFIPDGINRVLMVTDGDFNVGMVDFEALLNLVEEQRRSGISLTTLGFGTGNYNDYLMEQLADVGNGNYAYIDTLNEARKVLVEEISSTLQTIASDVKIQIEFNPSVVSEYRLIGYENRLLKREDFNNDKVDAGDIGAGHSITALYELALTGSKGERLKSLRYSDEKPPVHSTLHDEELAFLRLRYKLPGNTKSELLEHPLKKSNILSNTQRTSENFRFAAAVAAFGQALRGSKYLPDFGYSDILALARSVRGKDPFGYRSEFINLVSLANSLSYQGH